MNWSDVEKRFYNKFKGIEAMCNTPNCWTIHNQEERVLAFLKKELSVAYKQGAKEALLKAKLKEMSI